MFETLKSSLHHREGRGRKVFWLGLSVLLTAWALHAFAGSHSFRFGHHFHGQAASWAAHEEHVLQVLQSADLTGEQQERVKEIWAVYAPLLQDIHEEHEQLHEDFLETLGAPEVDQAALETLKLRGRALFNQAMETGSNAISDISQVLTSEQRQGLIKKCQRD